ncbi:hypothetical protein P7H62_03675 [Vagococcus carniphilus]|uniref:hypothetical protein n=1 Tax=Vagococcus carniphilus TaxID=218144 RepID=UPI00288F75E0|nr:hypothetical protein [Vagococcus carniphilus]MDT2830269.1 hypothetical protein [Vagococcus carniphilus]MDT2838701.1 hypothetical protein [Vagococcus carniphilus]MDT2853539.1 hypothetical protein [Vagococcus carniphilus]
MEQRKSIRPKLKPATEIQRSIRLKENTGKEESNNGLDELFPNNHDTKSSTFQGKEEDVSKKTMEIQVEIQSDQWYQTFRKTNQMELASLVKHTTLSPDTLVKLTGSYSTKMIYNLNLNRKTVSGINTRASRIYYDKEVSVSEAVNNDFLSYITYSLNYFSSIENEKSKKIYQDNLAIIEGNLYLTLFLNDEETIEVEGIYLKKENIVTGNIKTLNKDKYLKIFITEEKDRQDAIELLEDNKEEVYVLMTIDKEEKKITLGIYQNNRFILFSSENLKKLDNKVRTQDTNKQYTKVREKYEFERRVI